MLFQFDDKQFLGGTPDAIFAKPRPHFPFKFDEEVAAVFDDMVSRSVPFYREIMPLVAHLLVQWLRPEEVVYDLGCSTGTAMAFLAHWLPGPLRFLGVDTAAPMLAQATEKLAGYRGKHTIELIQHDLATVNLERSAAILCQYTLQFVAVSRRLEVIKNCFESLRENGVLILSEKLRVADARLHEAMTEVYESYKMQQGYTQTEIAQKRAALENVLVPMTAEDIERLLIRAGFQHVECIGRWNNFATFVAIKGC